MKGTKDFKAVIKQYLDDEAAECELFAKKYAKIKIDDAVKYILNQVQKSGINGFEDEEIFGMAVHFVDEGNLDPGKSIACKIVTNHSVPLTPADIEKAKQTAMREVTDAEKNKMKLEAKKELSDEEKSKIRTEARDKYLKEEGELARKQARTEIFAEEREKMTKKKKKAPAKAEIKATDAKPFSAPTLF